MSGGGKRKRVGEPPWSANCADSACALTGCCACLNVRARSTQSPTRLLSTIEVAPSVEPTDGIEASAAESSVTSADDDARRGKRSKDHHDGPVGKANGKSTEGKGKPADDDLQAEAAKIRCTVDSVRELRMLEPYSFCFQSYVKRRWLDRELLEVFASEFPAETRERYEAAIDAGKITVNGATVSPNYLLKDNDLILNTVHRHEPPVTSKPVVILHQDEDVVVVDKPASIPVHACGRYRHNTIVMLLGREHEVWGALPCHRLDRLTSGVLILAKNTAAANRIQNEIRAHTVQKEYVCRVWGRFPADEVVCTASIKVANHKLGVCCVDEENGKECKTTFNLISEHGTYSLVRCLPETGRMHQIRVHLQYLGFPIENDPIYNLGVGRDGTLSAPSDWTVQRAVEQVTETIAARDAAQRAGSGAPGEEGIDWRQTPFYEATCGECQLWRPYPKEHDLLIYLHAYRYSCALWQYQTAMPDWAC